MSRARAALAELADRHGVLRGYQDTAGRRHDADDQVLVAVLGALGAEIGSLGEAPAALAADDAARAGRMMEPVSVTAAGGPGTVALLLPPGTDTSGSWAVLEREDGAVSASPLGACTQPTGSVDIGARRFERFEVALPGGRLPAGYHHLRVESGPARAPGITAQSSTLVLAAPRCPPPRRVWGTFVPLHALRTAADRGIGTYGDLAALAAWTAERGGALVGTLPLHPTARDDPSPYLPISRLAWNELYVDPVSLPELARSPAARRLLEAGSVPAVGNRGQATVDYQRLATRQLDVLRALGAVVLREDSARRRELEHFAREHPEVVEYARFRACHRGAEPADQDVYLYAQWVARQQLSTAATAGAPLYLDLPIGVHPAGFDPQWAPEVFVRGAHGGAPPDDFFAAGQDWGFNPLHPARSRAGEYRYLRAVLRHAMEPAAAVRLDHVMGLHRLYWVPDGMDARHGAYVRYPHQELRALVAIEADRAGTVVVGEDLGTVPDEVRQDMQSDGMLRTWVYQTETSPDAPLPAPPPGALAALGTHDMARFAAFADGADIQERAGTAIPAVEQARQERLRWRRALARTVGAATDAPVRDLLEAVLCALARSPAPVVLVDLEDLVGEREPQNRPGTGPARGNWTRRAARTLEEMAADARTTGLLTTIDRARRGLEASR